MQRWRWLVRPRARLGHGATRPIRIRLEDPSTAAAQKRSFREPLRVGFGKDCDVRLEGPAGPDVVFELRRTHGPLQIWSPVPPSELDGRARLLVDGEPLEYPVHELKPGSRLEMVDEATQRRYRVVVDPPTQWSVRPRFLAVIMLVLVVVGAVYGAYLYYELTGTRALLTRTAVRLTEAESGVARTERRVGEALERMVSAEARLADAVSELRSLQAESQQALHREFDRRLEEISRRGREALARTSEEDLEARRDLEQSMRASIASLREELTNRMVQNYQRFKALEGDVYDGLAARVEAIELEGERFKRVYADSRPAVVLVRTSYVLEYPQDGEVESYDHYGSGFLVGEDGLGVTAQHVLFPWEFERELVVLRELGLVRVLPESIRRRLWLIEEKVERGDVDGAGPEEAGADRAEMPQPRLHIVYTPTPERALQSVTLPVGIVQVALPVPGPTDVAVFQIPDFARHYVSLAFAADPAAIEPLDEVLVVGYPFSRLEDGAAVPQAARGFVRRVGSGIMELDTPLHPGTSGGPILNGEGEVIAMAVGIVASDVYGMAVRSGDIEDVLEAARRSVERDERRLAAMGCDPGAVDGHFDADTWQAYRCEKEKKGL